MKETDRFLPPSWCGNICLNSGETVCVYDCAAERKARFFLPDPDLKLEHIAPFPVHDWQINSSPKERQVMAGLYLAKLVEAVTGVPIDPEYDRLKKELGGASYERTWEIVCELLESGPDISPDGQADAQDSSKPQGQTDVIKENGDIFPSDDRGLGR
jgi:hypothetical protein